LVHQIQKIGISIGILIGVSIGILIVI